MAYEVVPYSAALDAQIAELQIHLWSPDPVLNAAYLKWKHLDNPFLPEPLIELGMCAGRAVAMRSAFGTLWEVGDGSRHILPYADDFVAAPEHRNSGVARRVMQAVVDEASRRGFPYAVNLSAGPVTFVNSLAAGWRRIGSFEPLLRTSASQERLQRIAELVRRTPYVNRFSDVLRGALVRVLNARRRLEAVRRPPMPASGPISMSAEPRPEAMAALVRRLPWDGRMRHVRDERYFAWRFRNPLHEYGFLYRDDGGELQGYLVLQRAAAARPSPMHLNIADWEAANDDVRAALLDSAVSLGGLQLRAWAATAGPATRTLLQSRGFAAPTASGLSARSEGLLVRRLGTAAPNEPWLLSGCDLGRMETWDLRMLYSMSA